MEKSITHILGTVVPAYVTEIEVVFVPGAKFLKEIGLNE